MIRPEPDLSTTVCENHATLAIVDAALIKLWDVANELARIRPPGDRYRVTLFGSSRATHGDPAYDATRRFAEAMARDGCDIVTGGGPGLMEAANEGAQRGDPEDRTHSVGIRVDLEFEQHANPHVEQLFVHQTFFSRLHHFIRLSNAYVVVEGGIGTTLEMMVVWQLLQVDHLDGIPLVAVGPMWSELLDWARRHMTEGRLQLASPGDMDLVHCVDTVDDAVEAIRAHRRAWQERLG